MKTFNKSYFLFLSLLALLSFSACSDDDNPQDDSQNGGILEFKEGDVITREFSRGDEIIFKSEDVITNYGTQEMPLLFPINRTYEYSHDSLENSTYVVKKEEFEKLIEVWAETYNMPLATKEDTVLVCHEIFAFFFHNEADLGFFINLMEEGNSLQTLKTIAEGVAEKNIPVDAALKIYSDNKTTLDTKGTVKNVIGIIEGVIDLYNVWKDFTDVAVPIEKAVNNISAFISPDDTNWQNYNLDKYFSSNTYKLKYWVSGIWHAKFEYVVEGYTGTHPTIPGYFIPKSQIRTTYIDVDGPEFIGEGSYSYSPVINVSSSFDYPVVQVNGQVKVTYGDCCCCRFNSYLNFSLHGQNGFSEISFSSGR